MLNRRDFARSMALLSSVGGEALFAQAFRSIPAAAAADAVWLNANENPYGPPAVAVEAMKAVLPESNRYHFQKYEAFHSAIAESEGLEGRQVLVGAGSTEVLHAAIEAFTGPDKALVVMDPTYEAPAWIAESGGRKVAAVSLTEEYYADVKRLAAEAQRNQAGLVYLCNPNNPTSALTPKQDIDWLVDNLPSKAVLLIDEAYIHFSLAPNALEHVRKGKNVIVARTFSKIYGMAGLRVGFGCARPDLIDKMRPFRNNVISIVGQRAAAAALVEREAMLKSRREQFSATRADLCQWLRKRELRYIEPHANFVMLDLGRPVGPFSAQMMRRGVIVGRPFPPLTTMMRVTLGTDGEMARFKQVFEEVWNA